jgi:hypothetical protein
MAATSITGTGPGSADGQNRGSEHQTLGVTHLIGPKVVGAGTATLDSIGVTDIPVFPKVVSTDLVVMVNDVTDGTMVVGTIFETTSGVFVNLVGTPEHDVNWAVMESGT